tara:strand:+ start:484 stop:1356 length:873 start_codon:yes stop_codon:yes gene_type:complete
MKITRKQLENLIREELQTEKLVGKGIAKGLIQDLEELDRTLGLFDVQSLERFPDVKKELMQLALAVSDKLKYIKDSTRQFREGQGSNQEEIDKILDLIENDPEFEMLGQFKDKFLRFTKSGGDTFSALESALPDWRPIEKKVRKLRAMVRPEGPKTPMGMPVMENKSRRDSLKKIILEELQRECGMAPEPAVVDVSKDHSMDSQEGESVMAKGTLHHAIKSAQEIDAVLGDDVDLPEWIEAKLTKAADYLGVVSDYLTYKDSRGAVPNGSMELPKAVELPKPVQPPLGTT